MFQWLGKFLTFLKPAQTYFYSEPFKEQKNDKGI